MRVFPSEIKSRRSVKGLNLFGSHILELSKTKALKSDQTYSSTPNHNPNYAHLYTPARACSVPAAAGQRS